MAGWSQLPTELRCLIWGAMNYGHDWNQDPGARSRYATVCKEWQFAFERENFRLLVLDQDRLQDFETLVSQNERRRIYICRLVLRIKLEEYDCTTCESLEDDATLKR